MWKSNGVAGRCPLPPVLRERCISPGRWAGPGRKQAWSDQAMATKANEKAEGDVADAPQADSPLLDLSDQAVKRMIKLAKKRGFVTYEELNEVLPSEEVTSEQIEDILAMLNEMGINVVESEEADADRAEPAAADEAEEEEGGELTEAAPRAVPAKVERAEPTDRTDDPVRMYLREMG